ncbi:MAG: HAD-IB family hydrolase [Acidimicrobiaceae bacterium]|nr:HAD-IB family hydrolase [Acidimicrobiaceae bacterium]
MIVDRLTGKAVFITGSTGFLGTALVEKLLRTIPGCQLYLLIRPGRTTNAENRVQKELLKNDCFDLLREQFKDRFDEEISARIHPVSGDVVSDGLNLHPSDRKLLSECDIIIHSAASVSFDSPLDQAIEVNLCGPRRVAEAVIDARNEFGITKPVHLIAISTAYVAGRRRGLSPELPLSDTPFSIELDWRSEVKAARSLRADIELKSRDPKTLEIFRKKAANELGAAGVPLLVVKQEKLRIQWIHDEMVRAGIARATSVGWPDAYAYTKALGEKALLEKQDQIPLTIVRPSIIESAMLEPRPGWIRGFRMAEPIIISYARGLLKEFPGVPEGVIDVIPVDMVAAAIVAVAAKGPRSSSPEIFQVASGSRNPLKYATLVNHVRTWFQEHPLYDSDGQPIMIPDWSFPGRGRVQAQLEKTSKFLQALEQATGMLPIRGEQASFIVDIEKKRQAVDNALGYVELYGTYAETDAIFQVDNLLSLYQSLDEQEKSHFAFDPALIHWETFIREIHLPSVVQHARVKTTPSKRPANSRVDRNLNLILSKERHLAVFDLENTIISSNVVDTYAWLASRRLPRFKKALFAMDLALQGPSLLALDRKDRGDFLRAFYRKYEGARPQRLEKDSQEFFNAYLLKKSFPAAIERVRRHRSLGHKTLLITGALDFVLEPLKPLFDDIICAELEIGDNGLYKGRSLAVPPTGEARASILASYAAENSLKLSESVAYADSTSDLPMLEAVGYPVCVNPEPKLATIARKRGWHIEQWDKAKGLPPIYLPIGRSM